MKKAILIKDLVIEEVTVGDHDGDSYHCEYIECDEQLIRNSRIGAPEQDSAIRRVTVPVIEICESIPRTKYEDQYMNIDRKYYAYTPKVEAYLERPFRAVIERIELNEGEIKRSLRRISGLCFTIRSFNQLSWWRRIKYLFNDIEECK